MIDFGLKNFSKNEMMVTKVAWDIMVDNQLRKDPLVAMQEIVDDSISRGERVFIEWGCLEAMFPRLAMRKGLYDKALKKTTKIKAKRKKTLRK